MPFQTNGSLSVCVVINQLELPSRMLYLDGCSRLFLLSKKLQNPQTMRKEHVQQQIVIFSYLRRSALFSIEY